MARPNQPLQTLCGLRRLRRTGEALPAPTGVPRFRAVLILAIAIAGASGCPSLKGPGYLHPGSALQQQNQAQRFDPFPETDVGPDMAARPLGWIRPAPETERVQNAESYIKRYHQSPPPQWYRPPRTSVVEPGVPFVPGSEAPGMAPLYVP